MDTNRIIADMRARIKDLEDEQLEMALRIQKLEIRIQDLEREDDD
jgi:hypothetical protein